MRLTEKLDKLQNLAEALRSTSVATDPQHKNKYRLLVQETKECEAILQWFKKELTRPSVQMSLDPFLARGEIAIPLINSSGYDFQSFSFTCLATDYHGTVLDHARLACHEWTQGQTQQFRFPVSKAVKTVTVEVDSIEYETLASAAAGKPSGNADIETKCPYCGGEVTPLDKFCNSCGRQLMTDEERKARRAELLQQEISQEKTRYLRVLDQCSGLLNEEDLCAKISKLRGISEKLYERVQERPDMLQALSKYDNIYLPAIDNAVRTYVAVRDGGVDLASVEKTRNAAEQAIDIGIRSSQRLLNSFYKGDMLDVETDLDVLKQMFAEQ